MVTKKIQEQKNSGGFLSVWGTGTSYTIICFQEIVEPNGDLLTR